MQAEGVKVDSSHTVILNKVQVILISRSVFILRYDYLSRGVVRSVNEVFCVHQVEDVESQVRVNS
jgi:hypothetical protein